jgi:two-component system LytT family sensor kinase
MKTSCEHCGVALPSDALAYTCSYECTFCPVCASTMQDVCSRCGGELVRRPRRSAPASDEDADAEPSSKLRPAIVWGFSFGLWAFVALAYTATIYQLYRSTGMPMRFTSVLALQCSQVFGYALLTPFVFAFANRYPMRRHNWFRRLLVLLAGGSVFTVAHVALRGMTPYAFWDPKVRDWVSAVWDYQAHTFHVQWYMFESLFLSNVVDDVVTTYLAIVLVAHVMSYYQRMREREMRTSHLQAQLEKARLQALKSQLQPHFLFNTLNSISALMLTDVEAADRMITRLGDLLRISLETASTQMTTLSRELEFVNCYIEIEKVRFEERLNVIIDVAPETLDANVPHLLLQPLVDNAIKHGISKRTAGGEVRITVTQDDEDLHLEVRDNGPGFLDAGHSSSRGLGLRITRERLETIYGQDQSVELLSPPGGGVTARVSIPLHPAAKDGDEVRLVSQSTEGRVSRSNPASAAESQS